ncbi:unnamed protein product, partial [Bubo scandiacus]
MQFGGVLQLSEWAASPVADVRQVGSTISFGQYPTQPSYPVQSPANPAVYPQTVPLPQPPPYTDAPPAYSELYRPSFVPLGAATVPTMSAAYPGASVFLPMAQSVAVGPLGSSVPMAYYPVGPVYPPGSTVLVEGGFDAGARFGAGGTASIPPPPPGCPPQRCPAGRHAGSQRLGDATEGKLLPGRLRRRLHYLV